MLKLNEILGNLKLSNSRLPQFLCVADQIKYKVHLQSVCISQRTFCGVPLYQSLTACQPPARDVELNIQIGITHLELGSNTL